MESRRWSTAVARMSIAAGWHLNSMVSQSSNQQTNINYALLTQVSDVKVIDSHFNNKRLFVGAELILPACSKRAE